MTSTPLIPQDVAHRCFHAAFSLFVGRGRVHSCASVAAASGLPQRTVESYLSCQTAPSLANYQSLCSVLGQAFFNATLEATPFEVHSTEPGDSTPQALLTDTLGFSRRLSEMLEDGRIDHREAPELVQMIGAIEDCMAGMRVRVSGKATSKPIKAAE